MNSICLVVAARSIVKNSEPASRLSWKKCPDRLMICVMNKGQEVALRHL